MHSRWFNVVVVALWLTTMSWLLVSKVLPSILVGEPPSYRTILAAQRQSPTTGWAMSWNDERLGWAVNTTSPMPHGLAQMRSRVHFDYLPLDDIVPPQLQTLLGSVKELGDQMTTDVFSELAFDPLGRLSRFESALRFAMLPNNAVKVHGAIDGATLSFSVRAGEFVYQRELPISSKSMLGDAMSPQTHLPGLREGQTWTVELYSPLHPPTDPLEVLQVKVEGTERMVHNGETVRAWLVVYRTDPGSGSRNAGTVRGRMWVSPDGTVLQQEATVLNSKLTFTRLPDDEAAELAGSVTLEPPAPSTATGGASCHDPVRRSQQVLRLQTGRQRSQPDDPARRALCFSRPQRGRQDDDDQDAGRTAAADARHGAGVRL